MRVIKRGSVILTKQCKEPAPPKLQRRYRWYYANGGMDDDTHPLDNDYELVKWFIVGNTKGRSQLQSGEIRMQYLIGEYKFRENLWAPFSYNEVIDLIYHSEHITRALT